MGKRFSSAATSMSVNKDFFAAARDVNDDFHPVGTAADGWPDADRAARDARADPLLLLRRPVRDVPARRATAR